jgi:hypothetical protein
MSAERIYHGSVRAFSYVLIAIGIVLLITTLVAGGGPVSIGFVMGIAFVAVGGGRLWLSARIGAGEP